MDPCLDDALRLDYLNGTLSEKERALFEKHLDACPACRREIDGLRRTAAAVAGLRPPAVPAAWTAAAKARLREKASLPAIVPMDPALARPRTDVFLYAAIAAGITGGLVLLFGSVLGAAAGSWVSGLSDALGVSGPRAARTAGLVVGILSLHALLFVPSIVDNVYRLVRRGGRRGRPASSVLRLIP